VSATAHADTLAIQGLPGIEVLANPLRFPKLLLSEPPGRAGSTSMVEILDTLDVDGLPRNGALETL
jgi:hypothetical protein